MSDAKRKATGPPAFEADTPRGNKRQKLAAGVMDQSDETPQTTTEKGDDFLRSLTNAKDKTGRPIIDEFLTLPDRNTPGYYQEIKLPLAMDIIKAKLQRFEYSNLSALESDVKRMVANAKHFNEKGSAIYEDAERVRKTASNWMVKFNPAYRNPAYVAVATPIPGDNTNGTHHVSAPTPRPSHSVRHSTGGAERSSRSSMAPARRKSESAAPSAAASAAENSVPGDYAGKTFQQAQEQLMEELINYTEDDLEIFTPFQNLPSRTLTDYYQVIRHPVSLRSVQKKVRGQHGRNPPTWITDFHTWDAFEEEMSYIWDNCRTYNEDGSDMFNLAEDLEGVFYEKLAAVKKVVPQPPQTTLKLKMSAQPKQSIKIKFGSARDSPGSTPSTATPAPEGSTTGVLVHNEALERQREMVAAGMHPGHPTTNGASRNPFNGSKASSIPSLNPQSSRSGSAISPPRQTNGVKNEMAGQSPALGTVHPVQAAHQLQPSQLSQTHNGSPHPPHNQQQLQPSLYHVAQYQTPSFYGPPPGMVPGDSNFRVPDQDPSTYILPTMKVATHPGLHLEKPFSYVIPASKSTLHSSMTFTLPATHYYLQLVPHIPVGATTRPYRLFVTVNGSRQNEIVRPGIERDKERPLFEVRMEKGMVNRIEVELLAGGEMKNGKEEVQWEKMLVFVHVRRA